MSGAKRHLSLDLEATAQTLKGAVAVILIAKFGYAAAPVRHDRRMHTKIFIDTIMGSWDSAGGNRAVKLRLHVQLGHTEWIRKKNCSTYLTGSCMKTFPTLSASLVQGAKSC
jgi:hypothetical protein